MAQAVNLLLTDTHGIYLPQTFAENFDTDLWNDLDVEDIETIRRGPDNNDYYWDAWQNILDNARYVVEGREYRLHQDGDLWAVCDELMSEEEKINFYGVD